MPSPACSVLFRARLAHCLEPGDGRASLWYTRGQRTGLLPAKMGDLQGRVGVAAGHVLGYHSLVDTDGDVAPEYAASGPAGYAYGKSFDKPAVVGQG